MKTSLRTCLALLSLVALQVADSTVYASAEDTNTPDSGESVHGDFKTLLEQYDGLPSIKHEQIEINKRIEVLKNQVDMLEGENRDLRKELTNCKQSD